MKTEIVHGIEYSKPQVVLLQDTGIGTSEVAARTCYDSFENSENGSVKAFNLTNDEVKQDHNTLIRNINDIGHSDLLDQLAWTHFHHSILEHANLTYLIKGTSRGVLQEHARHRIQSISVRSTRYTMSSVINAFVAVMINKIANTEEMFNAKDAFISLITKMDLFVTNDYNYNKIEIETIYNKLFYQLYLLGKEEFLKISIAKSSLPLLDTLGTINNMFELLESGKKKRNVGDAFKHIVTDTWKVDMVVTFNLRSLKNYLTLRDSSAAYFQIRWLAQAMKEATPRKYLDLIIKSKGTHDSEA